MDKPGPTLHALKHSILCYSLYGSKYTIQSAAEMEISTYFVITFSSNCLKEADNLSIYQKDILIREK